MRRTNTSLIVVLVSLTIVLGTALTVVASTDLLTQRDEGDFVQPTVVFDETEMQSMPVLTDEQEKRAIDIALRDARVLHLLGESPYKVSETIVWTGSQSRLMGAVVTISLNNPTAVEGTWLEFSWACNQNPLPPPARVPYKAKFDGVTSLQVFANLNTGAVDQILPFADGGVELVGNRTFTGDIKSITSCYDD